MNRLRSPAVHIQRLLPSLDDGQDAASITTRYVARRAAVREATVRADPLRLRMPPTLDPKIRTLLTGLARAAATCRAGIDAYCRPRSIGGRTGERIAAGDLTILDEFAAAAANQIDEVRTVIDTLIVPRRPTTANPGSRAKVDELARRAADGRGLFHDRDRR